MTQIRLNKYLAQMGVASRRKIDEYILQKRIHVNSEPAELGDKVNPENDTVVVDKKIIKPYPPAGGQLLIYYLLNKPKFVLSSSIDDRGRKTVLDLVPPSPRVFPVGRLDYESTGAIILTNDGDLTLKITHPRYHLPKVYLVTILGKVPLGKIQAMQKTGIKAEIIDYIQNNSILKLTLYTGKKRQIRLLCASLHLYLLDLHRFSIGPVGIGNLKPGEYRLLSQAEVKLLNKPV